MKAECILKAIPAAMVGALVSFSPAYAARIYNEVGAPIFVHGTGTLGASEPKIVIDPGQRSESLEWSGVNGINVFRGRYLNLGQPICSISTGLDHHIVGGNYMIVRQGGCVICDSNNNSLASTGNNPSCQ